MVITSPANERIKEIRKLHSRKAREESGTFFIEGLRIVAQAVKAGARLETLVIAPELLRSEFGGELVTEQAARGVLLLEVSSEVFRRFSTKEGPQGIAAVVRQTWKNLGDIVITPGRPWVALDSVADPGNLGTILRTSDASGGAGVILLDQSTDPFDPSAVRASMGAVFDQGLVRCRLEEFGAWVKSTGAAVVGTSGSAEVDYHNFRYPGRLVLLMGSERQGLQPRHYEICDAVVKIPMAGQSDSLNLAVATAVVLYEMLNQRRDGRSI
jgi:TrmH family RNA methyltransferase